MEQEVIQAQQMFWDALKAKDKSLFEQVLADEFVSISLTHQNRSRAEFIATLTSFPAQVIAVDVENLQVHIFGEVALLTAIQLAQVQLSNGSVANDKIAINNLFKRTDNRWLMVLARPVEINV